MKLPIACNYSVVRFLPYPETGEFVNIGVVINSPQTGFFDFRIERRKFRRVANFFPELHAEVYREGILACADEIDRITAEIGISGKTADQIAIDPAFSADLFRELIRPRETLIRYSEPGTVLTPEPETLLNELFAHYVERMFAQEEDYQEEVMRKRVFKMLEDHKLISRFKQRQRVGNEEYRVSFPFVTEPRIGLIDKAIKPLNLAQNDSSKIFDHGEQWVNRVKRLQKIKAAPREILFTVNEPPVGSRMHSAFDEVCAELQAQGARILPAADEVAIIRFAKAES